MSTITNTSNIVYNNCITAVEGYTKAIKHGDSRENEYWKNITRLKQLLIVLSYQGMPSIKNDWTIITLTVEDVCIIAHGLLLFENTIDMD